MRARSSWLATLSFVVLCTCGRTELVGVRTDREPPLRFASDAASPTTNGDALISVGNPTVVDTDEGLYRLVDGAAPAYLERGWISSRTSEHHVGDVVIVIIVSDMTRASNAQAMFAAQLSSSATLVTPDLAVVDLGPAAGYRSVAFVGRCFIEASTSDHSEKALAALEAVTLETMAELDP